MAFDAFLQLDGIKGESTDKDHKDWIQLLSYSQSISQPVVPVRGGGGGVGAPAHQEFFVTKRVDSASPLLYEACATGKFIKSAVIEVVRSGARETEKYIVIRMTDVIITSASSTSGNDTPSETISLNYASIQWTYTPQNPDGSPGADVTASWIARR
jgi:type VI secretion system secreted protein Hcp